MTTLIRMDNCLGRERNTVVADQDLHCLQYEVNFQAGTQYISKNFFRLNLSVKRSRD